MRALRELDTADSIADLYGKFVLKIPVQLLILWNVIWAYPSGRSFSLGQNLAVPVAVTLQHSQPSQDVTQCLLSCQVSWL